jgi:hypothetical protein
MNKSGRAASVVVDPDTRRRAGTGGNGMIDLDGVATVADVSRVQGLQRPDAVALEFEGRATTFAEIDALASRIANQLIGSGIAPQERIAYLAKNSDHFFKPKNRIWPVPVWLRIGHFQWDDPGSTAHRRSPDR